MVEYVRQQDLSSDLRLGIRNDKVAALSSTLAISSCHRSRKSKSRRTFGGLC